MMMKKGLAMMILLCILMISTVVNAAGEVAIGLSASKKTIAPGEEVTITLSTTSLTASEGIMGILGTLGYDDKVFEKVSESNFAGQNGWGGLVYNSGNGKLVMDNGSSVKKAGGIVTITLKAKAGLSDQETTVSLKGVEVSSESNEYTAGNSSVKISIKKPVAAAENKTNTAKNTTTNNVVAANKTNTSNVSTAKKSHEKAGIESFILPAIAITGAIGIVSYVIYKKKYNF